MGKMILAGDIGGTKTLLALFELDSGELQQRQRVSFASADFDQFEEIIERFFQQLDFLPRLEAACFGIAGPVIDGACDATNLPWRVDSRDLADRLGLVSVSLLNDLQATAYGMLVLDDSQFHVLNAVDAPAGNRVVIAAGTGLGQAVLYWDGAIFHPFPTEGGHCDFAPRTPRQDALLQWMRKQYPDHVSVERVLSGPGIYQLYLFFRDQGDWPEPQWMKNRSEDDDPSAMVSWGALEQGDPLCRQTLDLFVEIYGAEAGNLALKTLAIGGVYVAGGIAPKILPSMIGGVFMQNFMAKGRFSGLLQTVPVKIALNQDAPLLGAAHFAVMASRDSRYSA